MDRRKFIKHSGTALLGSYLFNACDSIDDTINIVLPKCNNTTPVQGGVLSNSFRMIMNNDGNDGFQEKFTKNYSNESDFLKFRTTPLMENSHVDAIFYCTGTTHLFSHRTNIGENFNNSFLSYLKGKGTDPLMLITDHVHNYNKKVFFSLRMNDTHDSLIDHIFPDWKYKNHQFLMGNSSDEFPYGGNRWSAMDYEFTEVRDYIYALCEEVVNTYEIDGIELDFFRHPIFFRNQLYGHDANPEQIELMNNLIGSIYRVIKQKDLQLAIRIPDSLTICYKMGLDINTWLCNQWVDITSLSGYFHLEPWGNINVLKEVFPSQFYACLSRSRMKFYDNVALPEEYWRGEGILAKDSGADGVYTFNVFDPKAPMFYEFGDIEIMKGKQSRLIENEGFYHNYWVKNCSKYSKI